MRPLRSKISANEGAYYTVRQLSQETCHAAAHVSTLFQGPATDPRARRRRRACPACAAPLDVAHAPRLPSHPPDTSHPPTTFNPAAASLASSPAPNSSAAPGAPRSAGHRPRVAGPAGGQSDSPAWPRSGLAGAAAANPCFLRPPASLASAGNLSTTGCAPIREACPPQHSLLFRRPIRRPVCRRVCNRGRRRFCGSYRPYGRG